MGSCSSSSTRTRPISRSKRTPAGSMARPPRSSPARRKWGPSSGSAGSPCPAVAPVRHRDRPRLSDSGRHPRPHPRFRRPRQTGRKRLRQGTVTLPTLLFAQRVSPGSAEARLLGRVVTSDDVADDDMAELIDRIRSSGAIDDARAEALRYRTRAQERLAVVPHAETRDLLESWAEQALASS